MVTSVAQLLLQQILSVLQDKLWFHKYSEHQGVWNYVIKRNLNCRDGKTAPVTDRF